jgi:DNA repair/transcription protein MET18/MMS19
VSKSCLKGLKSHLKVNLPSELDLKHYYLLALSHLLRNVAKSTLVNELPKLFPMLLKSLESTDALLKQSTLESFSIMVAETPEIVVNHIDTIVKSLINLFVKKDSSSGNDPHVRVRAINLIGQFPGKIEYSYLSPLKKVVIKNLGIALDDHKLVVRREAANSRGKWFLLVGQKSDYIEIHNSSS